MRRAPCDRKSDDSAAGRPALESGGSTGAGNANKRRKQRAVPKCAHSRSGVYPSVEAISMSAPAARSSDISSSVFPAVAISREVAPSDALAAAGGGGEVGGKKGDGSDGSRAAQRGESGEKGRFGRTLAFTSACVSSAAVAAT